jgi:hypothetical protein
VQRALARGRLARRVGEGKLRWTEHVTEGLENAPKAFIGVLNGENRGRGPDEARLPHTRSVAWELGGRPRGS